MPLRIVLVYKPHAAGSRDPYLNLLPIGLTSLHALLLAKGYQSHLANMSLMSRRDIGTYLRTVRPDVVGISQFTHNRFESIRLAELAKKLNPDCFVVLGGPHATFRYKEILHASLAVDAVVLGEGEATLLEMLEVLVKRGPDGLAGIAGLAIRSGDQLTTPMLRPPLKELDTLPLPLAGLKNTMGVDWRRQLEFISTARGCPASCAFCSSPQFWGKSLRFRSPEAIVEEMRMLRDKFGLIYFSLRDDTFTVDRKRVLEFCKLLIHQRMFVLWNCQSRVANVDEELLVWMKRAGCECIQFGVESGSPNVLDTLGKGITIEGIRRGAEIVRKVGINLSIYLISGVPGENADDLRATLRLIEDIRPNDGQVSPLAYYPGTALFEKNASAGIVAKDIFEVDTAPALYVQNDDAVQKTTRQLLDRINSTAKAEQPAKATFAAQQRMLGYCHATNILAGELCAANGDMAGAEEWYLEITRREPDNPWGWLLLGELALERGADQKARQAFMKLIELVPAHLPAYDNLAELAGRAGDVEDAESYLLEAERLRYLSD